MNPEHTRTHTATPHTGTHTRPIAVLFLLFVIRLPGFCYATSSIPGPPAHPGGSHASVIGLTDDSPAVAKARGSFAMTEAAVKAALSNKADYERVLEVPFWGGFFLLAYRYNDVDIQFGPPFINRSYHRTFCSAALCGLHRAARYLVKRADLAFVRFWCSNWGSRLASATPRSDHSLRPRGSCCLSVGFPG